jgi:peroxidase
LPLSEDTCNDQGTRKCFFAGEHRTSENLGLVSIQTLFIREHNRIATELIKINPTWTDEKLYLETRRIIIALVQHIVYNEWLPVVTGNRTLSPLATNTYYSGYNENVFIFDIFLINYFCPFSISLK